MKLLDFSASGYARLSRFFQISSVEQALALEDFLGKSGEVLGVFDVEGPGTYYVLLDMGWDRLGDVTIFIVKKVPEVALSPSSFLQELGSLQQAFDTAAEPLALYRSIKSPSNGKMLTDEQKKKLSSFDDDTYEAAKLALDNFLDT